MKILHFLWTFALCMLGIGLYAQAPNLQLTLRYNPALLRYEVYALPDATQGSFFWGPSQISVVAPAVVPDLPFNVTSVAGGAWQDNSLVYAPTIAPGSDFHGIGSLGAPTALVANVEKLIFHFTLPGGGCTPGLRLYINGSDPISTDPGMAGGDFANTIFAIVPGVPGGYESYVSNYNNSGTSCNAPPVAVNDNVTTNEDTPLTFNQLVNDTDPNNNIDPTSVTITTPPTNGTVSINPVTGVLTYTPNPNYTGPDALVYSVCDTGTPVYCSTATVTITVNPINDPPVANNDVATTPEDTPVNISILANDTDVDGALNPATIDLDPATSGVQTSFTVAGQGTFTVNPATGVVTFTPVANFSGPVTPITYSVCDTGTPLPAQCDDATITVTVTPVNDPPVAVNDAATTPEDTPVAINILSNDTDVDGSLNPATVDLDPSTSGIQTSFTVPGQGTFVVNPATGVVTFTPVANFNGPVTPITYNVCDTGTPLPAQCASATITVTVTPVNDPPVAVNDVATTPEDTPVNISILSNDTDIDGSLNPGTIDLDPLTAGTQTSFTVPGQGTFTVNPATGVVTFTPVANFNGPVTPITYNVCDTGTPLPAQCASATITVTVTPVNDAPVAVNDVATTPEDTPVTINILSNDTDVDGTLNPATVDLDPSTSGIQTSFTVPGQGTFTVNPATGVVTFTPVANFNGPVTPITYNVCDTGTPLPAQCASATVSVTVTPVNDAPVANNDVATTPEDTPVTINILSNDTDIDGSLNPGTVDLDPSTSGIQTNFTVPGQGTFTVNPATGVVTFTPVANYNGPVTPITYNVCDTGTPLPAQCASATITVTVTPVNDPPVAVNDAATTPEDTPVTINILSNDSDVDGTLNPATVDLDPSTSGIQTTFTVAGQGTFTVNPATGVVTFTPVSNFNGPVTPITYNVCDTGTPLPAQCASATITVTVTPVNDPPVANNDAATTPEDTPVTINILSNDTDIDGSLNPGTVDLDPSMAGVQTSFTVAGQGTFTVNPATGVVTFTPVANFNGPVTPITYNVCDTGTPLPALCASATITVTVTPVNDPPTISQPPVTTPEDTPVTFCPTLGDPDAGDVLTLTLCNVPANGTAVITPSKCVTFTPTPNYNGTTTVCLQVCDQNNACTTVNVPVTVTPVNDAPVANNDVATTPEDTPVTINILSNDTDVDGTLNPATVDLDPSTSGIQTSFTVPGQGTFTVNPATGVVTFTPVANFNGPVTPITYNVCDTGTPLPSLCASATITVTVTPVNDPPVANNDVATTPENTPVTINILSNDTDVDGTLNPATIDLDPSTAGIQTTFTVAGQGTFTVNPATGIVTFTPVAGYNGTTTPITYNVCDTGTPLPALCDDATITVTVTPINDPPTITQPPVTTPEDTPVTFCPTLADPDAGDVLTLTLCNVPANGTAVITPSKCVTFTPAPNYNGTTTICLQVCDQNNACATVNVPVTVTPVNDAPVANNDVATTPEDTPVTINILSNDTDVDGTLNPATVDLDPSTSGIQTSFTVPGQGTFVVNPATGAVTFTPVANFNGPVTPITYNVCDTGTPLPSLCASATITVTVTPVNDPPVANNDVATTPEDTPVTINILSNDTDVDGALNPATVDLDPSTSGIQTSFTVPGQGTFTVNPATGVVTFTPVANFNGPVTPITYNVCDNGTPLPAQCASATITVTVTPVNDPPTISQPPVTTPEDTPVTFCPTLGDPDAGDVLTLTLCNVPANGTAVITPSKCVTFTPAPNYNGTTTVCLQVCDQNNACTTVNVPVTVTPVNDAPVANNDVATTPEDTPVTINILSNDTDVDGTLNPATVDLDPSTSGIQTSFTVPGQGTFTVNPATGVVTFTPVANFNGPVTPITYNVCDTGTPLPSLCASATITVTVTPVNDAPVANNDVATTPEDTPVTINILSNDTDVDGTLNPATVDLDPSTSGIQTSFTVPGQGTFTVNPATGVVTFTPVANFNGPVTPITYNVCDNGTPLPALCASATITVTVTPVNDPPTISQPPVTTPEDTPVTFCPTLGDPDAGDVLTLTLCNVPANGTAVITPSKCVTFTPAPNYNGTTTVCLQVCDQNNACTTINVPVTVTPVNDAPVANNDVATTPEDTPVTINILSNDTDVDGTLNPATVDLDPSTSGIQTSFTVPGQGTFTVNPATGVVTFTPVSNFNGPVTPITYNVCDNGTPLPALCDDATITVTVTPVNDPPVAVNDAVSTPEDTPITFNPLVNDTDPENNINPGSVTIPTPPANGMVSVNPVTGFITYTPNPNFAGTDVFTYNVCDSGTPILCSTATVTVTVIFDAVAKLRVKVLLQGAMIGVADGLMRDNLRAGGYLPLTEPYTALANTRFTHVGAGGGETTTTAVLNANGGTPNAVVDWVFVELRSALDSSVVLQTRSALVQRDGDVVSATDGTSMLTFNGLANQQFFVSVKHRNHLGAMTSAKVALSNDGTTVDFTTATNAQVYNRPGALNYDGQEMVTVNGGKRALWAGNTNANNKVKYQGSLSDNTTILAQALSAPGNTLSTYNYDNALGYFLGDVNMDGKVKYQGTGNDATHIFVNVVGLYTTLNTSGLYNYDLFLEQLP